MTLMRSRNPWSTVDLAGEGKEGRYVLAGGNKDSLQEAAVGTKGEFWRSSVESASWTEQNNFSDDTIWALTYLRLSLFSAFFTKSV